MAVDVDDLPATVDTATAAELLGIATPTLWRLAREGRPPVPVLRIGARHLRWPTAPLLEALGLSRPSDPRRDDEGDHGAAS